jgi:threonine/homoserine/homoserine lactone efflux protein
MLSEPSFLLSGVLIGLSVAVPVGPIGLLCIQRTLNKGRTSGLVSGLGAASADAVYGTVAAFGLTAVSSLLISEKDWIQLAGGVILLYLGLRTGFFPKDEEGPATAKEKGRGGVYTSTLALTLTNPVTIVFFTAVFAGLGVAGTGGSYPSSGLLVLGVFTGSALWWLILSTVVHALRGRFNRSRLRWLDRVSGGIILAFGLIAIAGSLQVVL